MATHPLGTDIYQTAVNFIDERRPFALLLVLRARGSTPRKAGTRAIVDEAGDIWGTIGGGLLESECRQLAREALHTRQAIVRDFHFTGNDACGDDPVCGGVLRVLIDPQPERHRTMLGVAAMQLRLRLPGTLITRVEESAVVMRFKLDVAEPIRHFTEAGVEGLAEPLIPPARLIIVGGGHVGQALARAAALAGFEIVVLEDRPEFADSSLFPPGATTHCGDVARFLSECVADEQTAIALVSRGHRSDAEALAASIARPWGYLGMMGSRRKVALMREQFLRDGLATPQQWERLHAPIGLDIGADTVPEIAVSIVAQLIAERRQLGKEGQ